MRVGSARRAAGIRVTRSSGSGEEDDQHSRPLSDPVANPGIKLTFVAAGISKLTETALTLHHALNTTEPFTHANHRLRKGLEYTAKYNLGYEVPFESNGGCPNCTSCKTHSLLRAPGGRLVVAPWSAVAWDLRCILPKSAPMIRAIIGGIWVGFSKSASNNRADRPQSVPWGLVLQGDLEPHGARPDVGNGGGDLRGERSVHAGGGECRAVRAIQPDGALRHRLLRLARVSTIASPNHFSFDHWDLFDATTDTPLVMMSFIIVITRSDFKYN